MRRYTLEGRLADVIRLISVLAIHSDTFRSEDGLVRSLNDEPTSHNKKKWKAIIEEHPEFFRSSAEKDHFALVIRSYFEPEVRTGDEKIKTPIQMRRPLTVEETQKLIDVAITLHDKEVESRNGFVKWFPIIVALITFMGVALSIYFNGKSNAVTNAKLDSLTKVVSGLNSLIKK
jgi:hypothetical protein